MASVSSSSTTITMRRPAEDHLLAKDINILDRLVWIKYDSNWWPAIIYKSYSEVQQHLYRYLDTILKTQFAMAIMLEMNSSKPSKVARILGKSSVELVAVDPESYHEFYWNLAAMIRQGCDLTRFLDNVDQFLEFHQALDEIVEIFTIYSRKQAFDLVLPDSGYRTWYDSAVAQLEEWTEERDTNDRDINSMYERGHPGSQDGSTKRSQTSCLKKNHRFSSSLNGSHERTPRATTRDTKTEYRDYDTTEYSPRQQRDAASAVSWPKFGHGKPNLKLGRGQSRGSVQFQSHDDRKNSKTTSRANIVWE
ncbi:hypothetical protein IV203_009051 [Nitzschia inconspicua]|uniref:Uncharacterized protein n=1 Tax=Nitzschia inconspicua TaxID=303405 RepID=A0A9K3KZS0_9STRA|nr:hypothetical protein IV203_009051 [Nitzschia inconspicua]